MPIPSASGHLDPEDVYELIEHRLSPRQLRAAEEHLGECEDCTETLAMILRSERPASAEEEAILARIAEPTPEERARSLAPAIASSVPRRSAASEWKPVAVAALIALAFGGGSWSVYHRYWLPAESRRIASETMAAIVESRQATGSIPLRYITELERAAVTRSGFDTEAPEEEALIASLRDAVARAPVPEAQLALALLDLDDDRLDEAEAMFQNVLAHDPASADALNGLAVVQYQRAQQNGQDSYGRLQKGLALLRQAQAASPDDLRILYNFGKFYEALEMKPAAIQAWSRYIEKDHGSPWAEEAAFQLAQLLPASPSRSDPRAR
jgi:tetratricopeptide (TPR) repeat protein